jgi:hypothetical protein
MKNHITKEWGVKHSLLLSLNLDSKFCTQLLFSGIFSTHEKATALASTSCAKEEAFSFGTIRTVPSF